MTEHLDWKGIRIAPEIYAPLLSQEIAAKENDRGQIEKECLEAIDIVSSGLQSGKSVVIPLESTRNIIQVIDTFQELLRSNGFDSKNCHLCLIIPEDLTGKCEIVFTGLNHEK